MDVRRRTFVRGLYGLGALPLVARPVLAQVSQVPRDTLPIGTANAYAVMHADNRLTTWTRLIDAAGLQNQARARGSFTIFALADSAFADMPNVAPSLLGAAAASPAAGTLPQNGPLPGVFPDTTRIDAFVRSKVVPGRHMIGDKLTLTSVAGKPIVLASQRGEVTVTWASPIDGRERVGTLSKNNLIAANAMIYVIDHVRMT